MAEFTSDWTTHNVRHWQKHLGHLRDRPAQGLEIGSYEGRSAVWWLEHHLVHPDSRLTCVDAWDGDPSVEPRFLSNVQPFADRMTILKSYSFSALRQLPFHAFDFVYVDGAHEGMNVLEDAVLSWRLLKVGGILVFDDYEYVGDTRTVQPKPAVDAFVSIYPVSVLHRGWQVIVRKDRENYYR